MTHCIDTRHAIGFSWNQPLEINHSWNQPVSVIKYSVLCHHHHHHLSLDFFWCCWSTIKDLTITFLHLSLSSATFWDSAKFIPVHSRLLSSHLFDCLPHLRLPLTVPCRTVFATPSGNMAIPLHFMLLDDCEEIVMRFYCLKDFLVDLLVPHMVIVFDA